NDIPRREAFEWYKSDQGKGMATWYKNTGPWWDNTNLKPGDGVSLEEEQADNNSLFNFYKAIIHLRQGNSALSSGSYQNAANNNDHVFSFIRDDGKRKVLIAVNLSADIQKASLSMPPSAYSGLHGNTSIDQNSFQLGPYAIAVWSAR